MNKKNVLFTILCFTFSTTLLFTNTLASTNDDSYLACGDGKCGPASAATTKEAKKCGEKAKLHPVTEKLLLFLNDPSLTSHKEIEKGAKELYAPDFINHGPVSGTTNDLTGFALALLAVKTDAQKNNWSFQTTDEKVVSYNSNLIMADRMQMCKSDGTLIHEKIGAIVVGKDNMIKARYVFPETTSLDEAINNIKHTINPE